MTLHKLIHELTELARVHGDCDVCVLQGDPPGPCVIAGTQGDVTSPDNPSKFPVVMLYTEEDVEQVHAEPWER